MAKNSCMGKNSCKKDIWEVKIEKNIYRLLTQLARAVLGNNWPLVVAVRTVRSEKANNASYHEFGKTNSSPCKGIWQKQLLILKFEKGFLSIKQYFLDYKIWNMYQVSVKWKSNGPCTWRWGTGSWGNSLRWGNPPVHIRSHFNLITFTW